jgi:hypothetical protein
MTLLSMSFGSLVFDYIIPFFIVALALISYILRAIPPFSYIWMFFKLILIWLFVGYAANMAKKSAKAWWEK